ncbi:MAG: Lrp/AsnC family transcriptional regulator [Pseudomonadales bacterium]
MFPNTSYVHDQLDQALIALLRKDGRAPLAKLSQQLGVSRGTVQNRLDKLLASGVVLGFTVRVRENSGQDSVRAMMTIEVVGRSASEVIRELRGIPELVALHTTNGAWDLVAEIQTSTLSEFDRVLRDVRMVDGVLNSETSILLSSM